MLHTSRIKGHQLVKERKNLQTMDCKDVLGKKMSWSSNSVLKHTYN